MNDTYSRGRMIVVLKLLLTLNDLNSLEPNTEEIFSIKNCQPNLDNIGMPIHISDFSMCD